MAEAHAVAQEDCQRNESSKPEQHRQRLHAQNSELVMRSGVGEAPRHDCQVKQRKDGPDGAEEEEVDLRWCHGVPVAGPPVGDYVYVSAWI